MYSLLDVVLLYVLFSLVGCCKWCLWSVSSEKVSSMIGNRKVRVLIFRRNLEPHAICFARLIRHDWFGIHNAVISSFLVFSQCSQFRFKFVWFFRSLQKGVCARVVGLTLYCGLPGPWAMPDVAKRLLFVYLYPIVAGFTRVITRSNGSINFSRKRWYGITRLEETGRLIYRRACEKWLGRDIC